MKEKLRQIERVRQLRETRERRSEASVSVATAKLREAEQLLAELKDAEHIVARESSRAMEAGERSEWMLSLTLRKVFELDLDRFEKERREREEVMLAARRELQDRRIETEQTVALRRDARLALQREEEHRAQAESVDRFLARRRWSSERLRVRSLIEGA
jgi:hypothetical protein